MKKISSILGIITALVIFNSCASLPVLDHGFYSDNEEQKEVATVIVDPFIEVTGIDKTSDTFATGIKSWKSKANVKQVQEFKLNEGVHTISLKYNSGTQYTIFSQQIIGQFKANKEYKITYKINSTSISFDVIDTETNESAKLDTDALQGKSKNVISQFINAVLNPTMEGTDKTVIEENDDYVLTNLPGMKYELLNKKTGAVEKGFRGFVTDFSFKKGTVYLYETNTISTKDEFLKSDYQKTSKTIFEVTDCDLKTVTYTYVKPDNLAGQTIKFNVSVKD